MKQLMNVTTIRYLVTLIYGVLATAAFAGLLDKKSNRKKVVFVIAGLLALQIVVLLTAGLDRTRSFYPLHTHLVLVLALILVFHCRILHAILYTMLAYMSCQMPAWISKLALLIKADSVWLEFALYFLCVGIFLYAIIRYAGRPTHELAENSVYIALALTIVPVTYYFFDYYTTVWTKLLYTGNYYVTQFMPLVICAAYLVFIVVVSYEEEKRVVANAKQVVLEKELYIVEAEIENLTELDQMTKIYRHDVRHHLTLLLYMIEEQQLEEAKQYIREHIEHIDGMIPKRFCDMEILNLLLSHFADKAEKLGVNYRFDIKLPDHIPLCNMELCALVSNAMENAIHELERLPEGMSRHMDLKLCEFNRKLVFSLDNTCDDRVVVVPNQPLETCVDGSEHGYGTKSIQMIADTYHGSVTFQLENGIFRLMVTIPL